jgi:hypothetical protein
MKKFILSLILASFILGHRIIMIANSKDPFSYNHLVSLGMTLIIAIGVPLYVWFEMKRKEQGKPIVDEMSKKVALKSYAISYYLSFISWGLVFGASEIYKFNNRTFFLVGTMAMIVFGLLSWLYYKIRGVDDV